MSSLQAVKEIAAGASVVIDARLQRRLYLFTAEGAKASETLTLTANLADGDTVTIDGKTYTAQATLTDADGNFLIGASASDTIDNLVAAITLGAGAGTLYAASTTLHSSVTAAAGAGDTMVATAKVGGTDGNSIAVSETSVNASWGAGTLSGGTDVTATATRVIDALGTEAAQTSTASTLTTSGGGHASVVVDSPFYKVAASAEGKVYAGVV